MTNGNDGAFNATSVRIIERDGRETRYESANNPLTKREYFAAMAMQGLLADSEMVSDADYVSEKAVELADALIEALNAPQEAK